MGLLLLSEFSSIPNFRAKLQSRRQQKERYTPTWTEWASQNGLRILRNGNVSGIAGLTIFTVPDDEKLFITSLWLSIASNGGINIGTGNVIKTGDITVARVACSADGQNSLSLNFDTPLEFESGEVVRITGNVANYEVHVGFSGFTFKKSLEIV